MNLSIKRLLLFAGAALFLAACEKPNQINPPGVQQVGVFFTDTITIKTSTVLLDTVVSSRYQSYTPVILNGQYKDPLFGNITASSFVNVYQPYSFNPGVSPQVDSLVLLLCYNTFYYGDTTQAQTLNVYRLSDTLNSTQTYYYNSPQPSYDNSTLLATKTFTPNPLGSDTLRIRFEPAAESSLGNSILQLPTLSNSPSQFYTTFRGLAILPGGQTNSILGFGTNNVSSGTAVGQSLVRLYYHNSTTDSLSFDFLIGGPGFNQVIADRSGSTTLSQLSTTNAIPSSQTNGQAFFQSTLGIATKIEFPYLAEFNASGNIGINQAALVINTVSTPQSQGLTFSPGVIMAETNTSNQVLLNPNNGNRPYYLYAETGTPGGVFGSGGTIQVAPLVSGQYTFNFTSYFQAMLAGVGITDPNQFNAASGKKPNNGMLLLPSSNYSIHGGIIAGDTQIKLKVYFTYLK